MRWKPLLSALVVATLSSGCAVLINLATDWKTNPWVWLGVGLVTVLAAVASWWAGIRSDRSDLRVIGIHQAPRIVIERSGSSARGPEVELEWTNGADGRTHGERREQQVLDLRFVNRGTGIAYMQSLAIEIVDVVPDDTPEMSLYIADIEPGEFSFSAANNGWGPARHLELRPVSSNLPEFDAGVPFQLGADEVRSGERRPIGSVHYADFDAGLVSELIARKVERHRELGRQLGDYNERPDLSAASAILGDPDNRLLGHAFMRVVRQAVQDHDPRALRYLRKAYDSDDGNYPAVPLRIDYAATFDGPDERSHSVDLTEYGSTFTGDEVLDYRPGAAYVGSRSDTLWISADGFLDRSVFIVAAPTGVPRVDRAYGVILPLEKGWRRAYPISHSVASNAVENIYVVLEAQRSGIYGIRMSFGVDEDTVVRSDVRHVHLRHDRNGRHRIHDGAVLRRTDGDDGNPRFRMDE